MRLTSRRVFIEMAAGKLIQARTEGDRAKFEDIVERVLEDCPEDVRLYFDSLSLTNLATVRREVYRKAQHGLGADLEVDYPVKRSLDMDVQEYSHPGLSGDRFVWDGGFDVSYSWWLPAGAPSGREEHRRQR
jgi:hypothetical protein